MLGGLGCFGICNKWIWWWLAEGLACGLCSTLDSRNHVHAACDLQPNLRRNTRLTLIVQIVLGLLLLVGLATIVMSSKNWHWTQLVLVLFIFFSAIGYLFLGAETMRIHRNLRAGIPNLEKQLVRFQQENEELRSGVGDKLGIQELEHRVQILSRERGRVWRNVMPAGQVDPQGRVAVEIAKPQPHGLSQDAIVYAFEAGNPNAADPAGGAQYLGEFRVTAADAGGASLEPVLLIDNRAGQRLVDSQGPWSLYETMPIDRHRLFAAYPEEQLREMLPAESVEEYLRHGTEATNDDDQWHVTGLDADGKRVGPENIDQAVKRLYDRSLRDYAFLFSELASEKVVILAQQEAVAQDNERLTKAIASAKATGQFRQQQIDTLNNDLSAMKQDRAAIEAHRDAVLELLSHDRELVEGYLQSNTSLANQLTQQQLNRREEINRRAPAPTVSLP